MEDPGPSCESIKSDRSMDLPIVFQDNEDKIFATAPFKSDRSINLPVNFKEGLTHELSEPELEWEDPEPEPNPNFPDQHWSPTQLDDIFKPLEEKIVAFVRDELKKFRALCLDYTEFVDGEEEEQQLSVREDFLNITLDFLKRLKQEPLAEQLHNKCLSGVCQSKLKSHLKQRFSCVSEGISMDGTHTLLNQIYTELYITQGGAAGVNQEHEVKHIEAASRKRFSSETTIKCEDIFKGPSHRHGPIRAEQTGTQSPIKKQMKKRPLSLKGMITKIIPGLKSVTTEKQESTTTNLQPVRAEQKGPVRVVLTKGVAGIGKTVLTQKFSLDWAEGRAHQDFQLLFPFTFRELNVLKDTQFSLVELLHHFFSPSKGLCSFQHLHVLFIFDGLDECRLPLDFSRTRDLIDPTESTSVHVLLVNLIRGRLLPSARLWITTRPAAANQIPAECVSMVTEVRGFADPQKEQYFRKRFEGEGEVVISHIKKSQSLYIMSHIPIFCWILSKVLEYVLETSEELLPQTLTQIYIHFLVVQAKVKSLKYDGRSETDPPWTIDTREMVKSLGKLAFEQLQKGNLIFYESDLSECGLDAAPASVYSGVFTQVFKEEPGLYQDKVYSFIHLSVQEFLAALHVHHTFFSSGKNLLEPTHSSESSEPEEAFYTSAVDQALQSPNGHLDLFLRFLLGLSLETNQNLLCGLLNPTENSSQVNQKIIKYIKEKTGEGLSTERSINLFHCLNELNDHTLVEQIQQILTEEGYSYLNPAQWSALVFLLLTSVSEMEVFDLKKYSASPKAFLYLLPVIKATNKANLSSCFLSSDCCGPLSSALCSEFSNLTHLDLSDNDLEDSGVEQLCSGLKSTSCRLETLSLRRCRLSSSGCGPLSSVLCSEFSSLTHLDLSNNGLKDSGVEQLCSGLKSTSCRLETLSLSYCALSSGCCRLLSSVLKLESSSLTHLDLSYNNLKDSGVELLCSGLKSTHCRLKNLGLVSCHLRQGSCGTLSTVLRSSSLTHLDLSENNLQDSGVELLCSGLKSATCRLKTLRLSGCLVTERGGAALASALSSAPSHLTELDLCYNHPGPSKQLLTRVRLDTHCPLETVRFSPSGAQWITPGPRKYLCELSLDVNTVHRALQLSEDQRTVTHVEEELPYPDHSERFDSRPQVLSSTELTRRSYWKVQWEGCEKDQPGWVDISVCCKSMKRKGGGKECLFGLNHESWTLSVFKGQYSFRHNGREFPVGPVSMHHVAVFLDPKAGFLTFYEVSHGGSRLATVYRLNTTFTGTLVAGFGSYRSSLTFI